MKIFLSSRYSRKQELRLIADTLRGIGHEIVSRWLYTAWSETDNFGSSAAPVEYRQEWSVNDLSDVEQCELFVAFPEPPRSNTRGGRHAELGAALAWDKPVILVGEPEHIFHHHPFVRQVKDVTELMSVLKEA